MTDTTEPRMGHWVVTSPAGVRDWHADDEAHAREQHVDAFGDDDPMEEIIEVRLHGPCSQPGDRVELVSMTEDPDPVRAGTKGTVVFIDGVGTLHVAWDDGRRLGLVPVADHWIEAVEP